MLNIFEQSNLCNCTPSKKMAQRNIIVCQYKLILLTAQAKKNIGSDLGKSTCDLFPLIYYVTLWKENSHPHILWAILYYFYYNKVRLYLIRL